jgi:hypothetical protein
VTTPPARRSVRPPRGGSTRAPRAADDQGFLSLEWVLTVPVMVLLASLVVAAGLLVRDVLVLQEAARVGARVASTTAGDQAATWAVHDAAPELADGRLSVRVWPAARRSGQQVQVEVTADRRYGPLSHQLRARSTARVEPIVDEGPGPASPLRPIDPTAPRTSAAWRTSDVPRPPVAPAAPGAPAGRGP